MASSDTEGISMTEEQSKTEKKSVVTTKHRYWHDQIEALAKELSLMAMACDIDMLDPGVAERILKNDESVCVRRKPYAFRKIRQHLMAFFPLKKAAIESLGVDDAREIFDKVWAPIIALREGKPLESPEPTEKT